MHNKYANTLLSFYKTAISKTFLIFIFSIIRTGLHHYIILKIPYKINSLSSFYGFLRNYGKILSAQGSNTSNSREFLTKIFFSN
jgi:hypothetical protein